MKNRAAGTSGGSDFLMAIWRALWNGQYSPAPRRVKMRLHDPRLLELPAGRPNGDSENERDGWNAGEMGMNGSAWKIAVAVIALSLVLDAVFFAIFLRPLLRARAAGIFLTFQQVAAMRRRRVPPMLVIEACAALRRSGSDAGIEDVVGVFEANRSRALLPDDLARLVREGKR